MHLALHAVIALSTMKIQLNLFVRHHCWQLVASLGINARIDSYMLLQGQVLSLRPDGMLYFSTRPLLCCETVDWKAFVGLGILFRRFTPKIGCPSNQSQKNTMYCKEWQNRCTKIYQMILRKMGNEKRFWFHIISDNGFSLIPAQDLAWCCQCSRRELGRRHGGACFRLLGVAFLSEDFLLNHSEFIDFRKRLKFLRFQAVGSDVFFWQMSSFCWQCQFWSKECKSILSSWVELAFRRLSTANWT